MVLSQVHHDSLHYIVNKTLAGIPLHWPDGVGSYTLADAETAEEPAKPTHLTDFGCLIGKIIAPKAVVSPVSSVIFELAPELANPVCPLLA